MSEAERQSRYRSKPEVKARMIETQRARRKADPEKYRAINRKSERRRKMKKYGLTEEAYAMMLEGQNYACAICKTRDSGSRDWHIDHCHRTGVVRGILCHHCNLMLGNARDSTDILEEAIFYLGMFEKNGR